MKTAGLIMLAIFALPFLTFLFLAGLYLGSQFGYFSGQTDALNGKWKYKQVIGVSTNYTEIK
jgi:hypothetical protein